MMKKTFTYCACLIITLLGFGGLSFAQNKVRESAKPAAQVENSKKAPDFAGRMQNPLFANQVAGAMWTLTHDYSDYQRSKEVMKTLLDYFQAFDKSKKGDSKDFDRLGGEKAFKDQLAKWLTEEDQSIRAFAAVMLGVSGDKSYAPQLANLLQDGKYKESDLNIYDRGRAAIALGMLEAKEYTQNLVDLLKSKNEFDRTGAVIGLGFLKAKDQSGAVRQLLKDKDKNVRQAAKESLEIMKMK